MNCIFMQVIQHYFLLSGEYIRVIVSSTQINKINTTTPVILQLISTNGTLLNETTLTICTGVFAGYITVPEVPYQYQIKGYDNKGYPFSSRKSLLNNPVPTPIPPTSVPEINTCPCENGGTCVTQFDSSVTSCSCPSGYSGKLCQEGWYPCTHSIHINFCYCMYGICIIILC